MQFTFTKQKYQCNYKNTLFCATVPDKVPSCSELQYQIRLWLLTGKKSELLRILPAGESSYSAGLVKQNARNESTPASVMNVMEIYLIYNGSGEGAGRLEHPRR